MAYCSYTDVQAEFKAVTFTLAAATPPSLVTQEQVTQFIVEADSLINSYVGSRYTVPVTGTQSLSLMSLFSRTLVASRVRGILANKQQTNTDANQQVKSDGLSTKDVMKMLQEIRDGITPLTDAVLLNSTASFFSNNYDIGTQPRFNKNRKQW